MDLVVDANILFAALVKEGKTAELLFREDLHLYAPDFLFKEFSKHEQFILAKTSRPQKDFGRLLEILKRRIAIVPFEEITPFLKKAKEISPDAGDVPYFALALKLKAGIWSNDNRLQSQNAVRVWKTQELAALLP